MIPASILPEQISWLLAEKIEVTNACDSQAISSPQICRVWPCLFYFILIFEFDAIEKVDLPYKDPNFQLLLKRSEKL